MLLFSACHRRCAEFRELLFQSHMLGIWVFWEKLSPQELILLVMLQVMLGQRKATWTQQRVSLALFWLLPVLAKAVDGQF